MKTDLLAAMVQLRPCRLLVIGDVMLDRYVSGEVERISPEAPVMVLNANDDEIRLGGAAGVATFARALGAAVSLCGVVGHDPSAVAVRGLCRDEGIELSRLFEDATRPTTQKERFIGRAAGRHAHQMLRVDRESCSELSNDLETHLIQCITDSLRQFDAVLIADYAKGVCTRELVAAVISAAGKCDPPRPVIVDPGRGRPADWYSGATVLKPNRHEGSQLAGTRIDGVDAAFRAAGQIRDAANVEHVVLTMDRDGCIVVSNECEIVHIGADSRDVYDITGAGDMFLATLGVALGNNLSLELAVRLASEAAGLEVERAGSVSITLEELRAALSSRTVSRSKLTTLSALIPSLAEHRRQARSIVFTNGCFDLLHVGHITVLEEAAKLGDVLIVAINSDASVKKLKGQTRPMIAEQDRARILGALECVDYVLIFDDDTPHQLLQAIRPDVLAKGGTTDVIVGREIVESNGGRVCSLSAVEGISTTRLIGSMQRAGQWQEK